MIFTFLEVSMNFDIIPTGPIKPETPKDKKSEKKETISRSDLPVSQSDTQIPVEAIVSKVTRRKGEIYTSETGTKHFSLKNKREAEFAKFTNFFAKHLALTLNKHFFPYYTWDFNNKALQKKHENNHKKLAMLNEKKKQLEEKIEWEKISNPTTLEKRAEERSKLNNDITRIEIKLHSTTEIQNSINDMQNKLEVLKLNLNIIQIKQELNHAKNKLGSNLSEEDRIKFEVKKELMGWIKDLKKENKELSEITKNIQNDQMKLIRLQAERNKLPERVRNGYDNDLLRLEEYQKLNEKGAITRKRFAAIGGERVTLETKDGAALDGIYLDAAAFRKKIVSSGGELITFSREDGSTLQGIAFDAAGSEKGHIITTLKDLNVIAFQDDGEKAGWTPVHYRPKGGEAKIVLVPTTALPGKSNQGWIENYEIKGVQSAEIQPLDTASRGGTVILSHGNMGVYEQHKEQAAAFLFLGMNVMLFNYRGVGQSSGVPSDQSYKRDIETVYQFVKKRHGQDDSKILLKGQCFGGGPSAYAASLHPETNLFLDQSYSSFRNVVETKARILINESIDKFLRDPNHTPEESSKFAFKVREWFKDNIAPTIAKCASLLAPDFQVAKNLAENTGHKALFYVRDDEVIPKGEVEKIANSAKKEGFDIKIIESAGRHDAKWMEIESIEDNTFQIIEKVNSYYDGLKEELFERIQEKERDIYQCSLSLRKTITPEEFEILEEEKKRLDLDLKRLLNELSEINNQENYDLNEVWNLTNKGLTQISHYRVRDQMIEFLEEAALLDPVI